MAICILCPARFVSKTATRTEGHRVHVILHLSPWMGPRGSPRSQSGAIHRRLKAVKGLERNMHRNECQREGRSPP